VITDIENYANSILQFKKPLQIIDSTDAKRALPDFGQKINIAELVQKKRLLIADEM
jgi:hypothetical protein